MFDIGSIPWFFAVVGGTVVLGLGIAYAVWQWRHRNRRLDPLRERVTRQNYAAEEREAKGQDATSTPNITPRSRA
jgi:hypothetical protein